MTGVPAERRERFSAETLYLVLTGGYAFLFALVTSVNLFFQTERAHLNPLQLVLVGTVYEGTSFLCEFPTGVLADVVSRKLSVLIGLTMMGCGFFVGGAFARFDTILLAQVIAGCGFTFLSGAKEAWIADELGGHTGVGKVFMRGGQVDGIARLIAIPIGTLSAAYFSLNLPILMGGALFLPLAFFLSLTMREQGWRPPDRGSRPALRAFRTTSMAGPRLVFQTPLLITIFVISALHWTAAGAFDRLWIAHFTTNIGLPVWQHIKPVIWIGIIREGAILLGIILAFGVSRRVDMENHASVTRGLFICYAALIVGVLIIALTSSFVMGMLAFWAVNGLARVYIPLKLSWINQSTESSVRATVFSMNSQFDHLGQIAGSPWLGAIGSLFGLRAALSGAAAVMVPGLALFMRALGQGPTEAGAAPPPPAKETAPGPAE